MKFGVVVFPGSNCERDMQYSLEHDLGYEVCMLWHKDTDLSKFSDEDWIILPGGFSYGDYLRCGAIARFSPMMQSVIDFARNGGKVLGVCNGFQILCEAHLLPGVLLRNANQQYISKNVHIRSISQGSEPLTIPIAHGDGRFYADQMTMAELEFHEQIIYKYCDKNGIIDERDNPNGSLHNVAGICNKKRNVFAMMPHPERASCAALGNMDGKKIFEGLFGTKHTPAIQSLSPVINF